MNYRQIQALLVQTFNKQALIIVPECYRTGHECDLMVVHKTLRLIDIEIKMSRADFKRDAAKDKWWRSQGWQFRGAPKIHRDWPPRIWKHYFAMPADIWKPDMVEFLPSPASGVILLYERGSSRSWKVEKNAKPDRMAEKIKPEDCLDIGRLAGLRMWDALVEREPLPEQRWPIKTEPADPATQQGWL